MTWLLIVIVLSPHPRTWSADYATEAECREMLARTNLIGFCVETGA